LRSSLVFTAGPSRISRTIGLVRAPKPPHGPDWVHEIKHDGYRLPVQRDGDTVRLFTRRGYDWTGRYPAIASIATKLRAESHAPADEIHLARIHCHDAESAVWRGKFV
jgi:ATP-dependent DNA ligase